MLLSVIHSSKIAMFFDKMDLLSMQESAFSKLTNF
jgi:hypothetical protein